MVLTSGFILEKQLQVNIWFKIFRYISIDLSLIIFVENSYAISSSTLKMVNDRCILMLFEYVGYVLKEFRHDLSSAFFKIRFIKFESHIWSYKRVSKVISLCLVNKAWVLLLFIHVLYWIKCNLMWLFVVDKIIYLVKEIVISLHYL